MTAALVDIFCRSFPTPPAAITLDIDETCDAVHSLPPRTGGGPSAAFAVQRLLRHPLLPAGARLPCRERQAGGGSPAPRQDAFGGRGPHHAQAPDAAHPPALAAHPAHLPGRQPLRPDRGDGVVRGQRRRLHLRPGRQCGAARPCTCRRDRRGGPGAPRRSRWRQGPRLRRLCYAAGSWNRARRVVARLEATARGFDARYVVTSLEGGPRHLYEGVYCGRGQAENLIKLHKASCSPARLRPHLLPEPARQPLQAGAAHRRLLADARAPRCRAAQDAARMVGVRHPPPDRHCSRSAPGWWRRPPASASTWPRPVPTPPCSACWLATSGP